MKDEDIKLPKLPKGAAGWRIDDLLENYAREAVRLNFDPLMKQRSDAWYAVVEALNEALPGWVVGHANAVDGAVAAIKRMADQGKDKSDHQGPRPFDLEAAKRGEPIVTRDGRNVRFVAYVQEVRSNYRVLAFIEGENAVSSFNESGQYYAPGGQHEVDLLMAPKSKRVVWLNLSEDLHGSAWTSKLEAEIQAGNLAFEPEYTAIRVELD